MGEDVFERFAEHRTGAEMQALLHHGHWIPVLRGHTAAYVERNFTGWTWNELIAVCRAAGIVVHGDMGGPPSCDPRVRTFHFTDDRTFAVEWNDGTSTFSEPGDRRP